MNVLRFALVGCLFAGLVGCRPSASGPKGSGPVTSGSGTSKKDMIVGKWEVVGKGGSYPRGARFEFAKDGKMTWTFGPPGQESVVPGTYKVDGDKLTTALDAGGGVSNLTFTITRMAATEMTTTDELGKTTHYKKQ